MKFKLIQLLAIATLLVFTAQDAGFSQEDGFGCLRPLAKAEKEADKKPDMDGLEEALDALVDEINEDVAPGEITRGLAVTRLGGLPEFEMYPVQAGNLIQRAMNALLKCLEGDSSKKVRDAAASSLGHLVTLCPFSEEAENDLLGLLKAYDDVDFSIRRGLISVAGSIRYPSKRLQEALPEAIMRNASSTRDPEAHKAMVRAIGDFGVNVASLKAGDPRAALTQLRKLIVDPLYGVAVENPYGSSNIEFIEFELPVREEALIQVSRVFENEALAIHDRIKKGPPDNDTEMKAVTWMAVMYFRMYRPLSLLIYRKTGNDKYSGEPSERLQAAKAIRTIAYHWRALLLAAAPYQGDYYAFEQEAEDMLRSLVSDMGKLIYGNVPLMIEPDTKVKTELVRIMYEFGTAEDVDTERLYPLVFLGDDELSMEAALTIAKFNHTESASRLRRFYEDNIAKDWGIIGILEKVFKRYSEAGIGPAAAQPVVVPGNTTMSDI